MSYVKKKKVVNLSFEVDHPLHGLELKTKSVDFNYLTKTAQVFTSIGELQERAASFSNNKEAGEVLNELSVSIREAFELFATKLISWNYEIEDEDDNTISVPSTVDGMLSIEDDLEVLGIINSWLSALSHPAPALGKDSSSGETSPELSQLMEPLSPSQESSTLPSSSSD